MGGRAKARWNWGVLAAGAATVAFVVGCGAGRHKWTRPDATAQLWNRDNYVCMVQAGFYLPNPYSPLVVGNNDPSWGLGGLLYKVGQQQQYNDCMRALGWTPEEEVEKQEPSQQPAEEAMKQALVKLRESEPREPFCGVGYSGSVQVPGLIVAVGPRAQAEGLRAGDTIVAVDGERILPSGDPRGALRTRKPGDTVALTVRNGGVERDVRVECMDGRVIMEAQLAAAEAATQHRWDDCAARCDEFE
jgi:hypothetical protein